MTSGVQSVKQLGISVRFRAEDSNYEFEPGCKNGPLLVRPGPAEAVAGWPGRPDAKNGY